MDFGAVLRPCKIKNTIIMIGSVGLEMNDGIFFLLVQCAPCGNQDMVGMFLLVQSHVQPAEIYSKKKNIKLPANIRMRAKSRNRVHEGNSHFHSVLQPSLSE